MTKKKTMPPSPYVENKCWCSVRIHGSAGTKEQQVCGVGGAFYVMRRAAVGAQGPSLGEIRIFMCDKHAAKMVKNGYVVTRVTD